MKSRTPSCSLLALLLALLLTASGLRGASGEKALGTLLDRVEVRRGFSARSAVLLPFVLREGVVGAAEGQPAPEKDLDYSVVKDDLVNLDYTGERPSFLPAGTLIRGRERERILSRSVFLVPGAELVVQAPHCDSLAEDTPEAEVGTAVFGPVAPHEQRKVGLLSADRGALSEVQRIQAALAGLGAEAATVKDVMAAPEIADRVGSALARLADAPRAYGEAAAGHALFIGFRPVEVVLFREPADYVRLGPDYLRAAAVSLTLWEEYYGVNPLLVEETDDRLLIPVAERILTTLKAARASRFRPASKEKGGGDLVRINADSDDPVMKFTGRMLVDVDESPFFLHAYQDGRQLILSAPLTKPGGRPTDAKPDVSHGAMTFEFIRRLTDRMGSRR